MVVDDSSSSPPSPATHNYSVSNGILSIGGYQISGVDVSSLSEVRHAVAFYEEIIQMFQKSPSFSLMDKKKNDYILSAMTKYRDGTPASDLRKEFPQIHKWAKTYRILTAEGVPPSLVHSITDNDSSSPKKYSFLERVYADIRHHHGSDHCKSRSLYHRVNDAFKNISRTICDLFCKTCPTCVAGSNRHRPAAGLRPILTNGFGKRGQVDLIDYQSMPDGKFRYLLNYIDHGCKFLISIPIRAKTASCVAHALFDIFTLIGPPSILQSDNGKEFSGAAMNSKQRREKEDQSDVKGGTLESFTDKELGEVITNIRELWPDCLMVRGSPRHSQSNGGVERVNQTVEKKLAAWMKENKSTKWSVGCRVVMFRYNTQFHHNTRENPYRLTFGQPARVGLCHLPFDRGLLESLATERELNEIVLQMDEKPSNDPIIEITDDPTRQMSQLMIQPTRPLR